jgi:hypothetical protein
VLYDPGYYVHPARARGAVERRGACFVRAVEIGADFVQFLQNL